MELVSDARVKPVTIAELQHHNHLPQSKRDAGTTEYALVHKDKLDALSQRFNEWRQSWTGAPSADGTGGKVEEERGDGNLQGAQESGGDDSRGTLRTNQFIQACNNHLHRFVEMCEVTFTRPDLGAKTDACCQRECSKYAAKSFTDIMAVRLHVKV